MNSFHSISTEQVRILLDDSRIAVIDTRPTAAYNGWHLNGEKRGGHLPGARSLPYKWTRYIDWIEIVRSKGIHPEQTILVYGDKEEVIVKVADRFLNSGYEKVVVYHDFTNEWLDNPELPIDKLPQFEKLVYPEWVQDLLAGQNPPSYAGNGFVLCHVHYRNPEDYLEGHIPGAISLDTNLLESSETWNRRDPEELKANLEAMGITKTTTAIVYGRFSFPTNEDPFPGSSAGHLGAIRCALILMYAGVQDVRILNGGIQSWIDAGFGLTREVSEPVPVKDCGLDIPERPELIVDLPQAKEMLNSADAELVCVRSWPEYIGDVSGYHYIQKTGRIPGAVFGNCGSDAYHMENYRNLDHTTKEYNEIRKDWEEVGILPEKHVAFYCGTGWRGSEAWLNAWLMNWPRVSVFDGGWFEWSNDPDNPIETGTPEKMALERSSKS